MFARVIGIPIVLITLSIPISAVGQDCIQYEDYMHWEGWVDTPGLAFDVRRTGQLAQGCETIEHLPVGIPVLRQEVLRRLEVDGTRTSEEEPVKGALGHAGADLGEGGSVREEERVLRRRRQGRGGRGRGEREGGYGEG